MATGDDDGEREETAERTSVKKGKGGERGRGGMAGTGTKRAERGACDQSIYSWASGRSPYSIQRVRATERKGGQHGRRCEECRHRGPAGCTSEGATRWSGGPPSPRVESCVSTWEPGRRTGNSQRYRRTKTDGNAGRSGMHGWAGCDRRTTWRVC
ncbi:hypothetical protein BJY59DRAFT_189870 [Rhodotorula toruloides]